MTDDAVDAILLDKDKGNTNKPNSSSETPPDSINVDSPNEHEPSPPHTKKRRSLGCFALIAIVLFVCISAVAGTYFLMRMQSESRFNSRLNELAESGTPVLLEDLPVLYEIPNRALDSTEDWITVLKTIASTRYQDSINNVDLVALPNIPKWPPHRWDGFPNAQQFISAQDPLLTDLRLATMEYARFDFDANSKHSISQRRLRFLSQGYEALELACFVSAHKRDRESFVHLLVSCLGYHRCLQIHPAHQTEQLELLRRGYLTLQSALQEIEFTEKELTRFRNQVSSFDPWTPANRYWNLQRNYLTAFYNEPEAFDKSAMGQAMAGNPEWIEFRNFQRKHRRYSPYTGDDGLKFLEYMDQIQAQFNGNPIKAFLMIEELEKEIADSHPQGMDQYRFPTANDMVPSVFELVKLSGEVAALQNVILAGLAFDQKRIQSEERVLLEDSAKASQGFLADEPVDLYTGFPLTVNRQNNELTILSTGPNRADDKLTGDDIGIRLPRQKWNFQDQPTQKIN